MTSKATLRARILFCASLTPALAAAAATRPAADDARDTEADCLIKISADPRVFPVEPRIVELLVLSSGVAVQAARDVIPTDYEGVRVHFDVLTGIAPSAGPLPGWGIGNPSPVAADSPGSGGQDHELVGLLTVSSNSEGKARQIMAAVIKRLESALARASEHDMQRLDQELRRAGMRAEEARERISELHARRRAMLAGAPVTDLARESILEMTRRLETERQDTSVRIEAMRARMEAIHERMAAATRPAARAEAASSQLAEIARNLDALRQTFTSLTERLGPQHPQVIEAHAGIRAAEKELSDRERQLLDSRGSLMAELNNQIAALSIDMSEAETRLKALELKCREMRDLLEKADDYELQIGIELPLARSAYERARLRREELEIRAASIRPPAVTVLGE